MTEPVPEAGSTSAGPEVSRRGLLKYVLLGFSALATAAGVLTPVIAYIWPPARAAAEAGGRVAVATTADLPVGQGAVFSVQNKPVIVINTEQGVRALSAVCTHLGCIVFWNPERQVIACPCHEAYFSINGAVISGPPPAPLEVYRVQVEGDEIVVEGGES
ncbi:MAG TPA: Rieske (2Fe-2S) protein [Anaerolineae bacterium]|nr:Rieske (2Fe-2S) protein [Anaerolineae bacterium]